MVFNNLNKQEILLLPVFPSSVTLVRNPMAEQEAMHNYYLLMFPETANINYHVQTMSFLLLHMNRFRQASLRPQLSQLNLLLQSAQGFAT